MQKSSNLFGDEEQLKQWCINLHNSLGGFEVTKTITLSKKNMTKVKSLCEQFVLEWNTNMLAAIKSAEEEE